MAGIMLLRDIYIYICIVYLVLYIFTCATFSCLGKHLTCAGMSQSSHHRGLHHVVSSLDFCWAGVAWGVNC